MCAVAVMFAYAGVQYDNVYAVPGTLTTAVVLDELGTPVAIRSTISITAQVRSGRPADNATFLSDLWNAIREQAQPCGLLLRNRLADNPSGLWFSPGDGWLIVGEEWPEVTGGQIADGSAIFTLTLERRQPFRAIPGTVWEQEIAWDLGGETLTTLPTCQTLAITQTESLTFVSGLPAEMQYLLSPPEETQISVLSQNRTTHPTLGAVVIEMERVAESATLFVTGQHMDCTEGCCGAEGQDLATFAPDLWQAGSLGCPDLSGGGSGTMFDHGRNLVAADAWRYSTLFDNDVCTALHYDADGIERVSGAINAYEFQLVVGCGLSNPPRAFVRYMNGAPAGLPDKTWIETECGVVCPACEGGNAGTWQDMLVWAEVYADCGICSAADIDYGSGSGSGSGTVDECVPNTLYSIRQQYKASLFCPELPPESISTSTPPPGSESESVVGSESVGSEPPPGSDGSEPIGSESVVMD